MNTCRESKRVAPDLLQAENAAFVNAKALKDAVAIKKTMVKDADLASSLGIKCPSM
jgi:hypothetical protein